MDPNNYSKVDCDTPEGFNLMLNVMIHVTILFLIISLFFHLYISKLVTDSMDDQIGNAIPKLLKPELQKFNTLTRGQIDELKKTGIMDKLKKIYRDPTDETVINNSWLSVVMMLIGIMLITMIITISATSYGFGKCPPLKELLLENIVTFTFVGMIEIGFFMIIISKYIPSPPSLIATSAVTSLQKYLVINPKSL